MQINHVGSSQPLVEISPSHSRSSSLTQGAGSSARQQNVPSLIQQGIHDKNKQPMLEQGSGSEVKSQSSRLKDLRSALSSGGMIQNLPRTLRDSLLSGGPIHSVPRTMREALSSGGPIQSMSRSMPDSTPVAEPPKKTTRTLRELLAADNSVKGASHRSASAAQEQKASSESGSVSERSDEFYTPPTSPRPSDAETDSFHSAPGSSRREDSIGSRPKIMEQDESSQTPIARAKTQQDLRAMLSSCSPIQSMARMPPEPTFNVKIDDHGKLQFGKGLPDTLITLLQQTLGKNHQPFVSHHESQDGRQQMLLDKSGRQFMIQSEENSHVALHSSGRGATAGAPVETGRMNHELLTGVYQQPASSSAAGEQLRIHDGKLFSLKTEFGVWQKTDDTLHSQLSWQGDGQLYAIKDGQTLSNLSAGTDAASFSDKISAFSANQRGQVAVLTEKDHMAQLHLSPSLDAASQTIELKREDNGPVHASAVAITNQHLLIADNEGKLFHALLPKPGEQSVTLESFETPELDGALGADHRITGFAHDEQGQTHALATDRQGQKHVASLGENALSPTPGWNLSDSLVVDDTLGLKPLVPENKDTVDLGHQGKLALQDGQVHFYNGNAQAWESSGIEAVDLKRGLDNKAYILKDGEVKPLAVNLKSAAFPHGDNNVFALAQVRPTPSAGLPLPGISKEDGVSSLAVISRNKFIVVNQQGDLHFHHIKHGTEKLASPPLALPNQGLTGAIRNITLDSQQNLFALNNEGKLFQLPKNDWQNAANHGEAQWQPVKTPIDGKITSLGTDAQNRVRIAHDDHQLHTMQSGEWKTEVPKGKAVSNGNTRAAEDLFNTLNTATKGKRMPLTGLTAKADFQVLGKTGEESQKVKSKLADLVRAHIVNFSLEVPRPLKTFADHVQHQAKGREGLKPVYEMQSTLLNKLETATTGGLSEPAPDLASKIKDLDLGKKGQPLVNLLKQFHSELESSSAKAAMLVGKQSGVMNDRDMINTEIKSSTQDAMLNFTGRQRQEKDLAPMLLAAMKANPATQGSTAATVIQAFVDSKTPINQKMNTDASGVQRDKHDPVSLAKSQLVLDTLMLGQVHQLTDRLSELSGTSPDEKALAPLMKELNSLRQNEYGANPVKKLTDMGFTNHKVLEADYDAVKTFMKAFRKEDAAISVTSKTVMQASNQTDLADKMKATLTSMAEGDSITFSRSYGAAASAAFVVTSTSLPFPPVPGAGVNGDRGYSLNFTRLDNTTYVAFERSGGITGKLNFGSGYDVSEYLVGTTSAKMAQQIAGKHNFTPDTRFSASISAGLQVAQRNALYFALPDEEIPGFVDGLTSGTLDPLAVMSKGAEHSVKAGRTVAFNLEGSAALELRGTIDLTNVGAAPVSVLTRGTVGVTAGANFLSANKERSVTEGEKMTIYAATDNRMRVMNQAVLGANAALTAGMLVEAKGLIPVFPAVSIGGNLTVDSRTSQLVNLIMKKADPVEKKDLNMLIDSLSGAFTDPASKLLIDSVKKMSQPDEQLTILNEHFTGKTAKTDAQHQGLTALKRLDIRQDVAQRDGAILSGVLHMTTYTNLKNLTENGLFHVLGNHLSSTLAPSNAERITPLIAENPALKDIVSQLQKSDKASVMVTLELKDDVREKIEQGLQNQTIGKDDVIKMIKDRNNLRLANIDVNQIAKKSEGFTTPAVIVNATSSAGVTMSKLLGGVDFKYGKDQTMPQSYQLRGEIAKANPSTVSALQQLHQYGLQLKG
ncbi:pathogenicity factor AvrE|uniref:Pathogenicity factor AvrE n=1 Tax=Brenneria salicis ATCC 15712 = DSM 30166 TaxID=714314 RepID=A0A366I8Q1_9GAMM|nr:AvrE-family type 3 secretion system effector [Brenneria salicis]NMN91764.1 pathogenicity factor AvrE [Brenneria salicis ATCC 15712 = DSM 30166]RBP65830.1 pathogenicity factor AvrE [Brenneria salicis ATCC 15712 = DSM 30166]RLM31865.1 avirulence protein [Brenneria salicis ATCC 15712 = DSM 30166]